MRKILLIWLQIILCLSQTLCTTQLFILGPQSLSKDNEKIDSNLANYGDIPYGKSLIGSLHRPQQGNSNGCEQIKIRDIGHQEKRPFIIMNRGGCTFVQKTRRAQTAGAKVAIIANRKRENDNILMSDDGTATDISIPTIMISFNNARDLYQYLELEDKQMITLMAEFQLNQFNQVNYQFLFGTSQMFFYDFLIDFQPFYDNLLKANLNILYQVHSSKQTGVFSNLDCYGKGKYCVFAPSLKADGKRIIDQTLRQLCILNKYGKSEAIPRQNISIWLTYVKQLRSNQCGIQNTDCIKKAINNSKIDAQKVQNCIQSSFVGNKQSPNLINQMLDKQMQSWSASWGNFHSPAVTINNYLYRGNFQGGDVFNAICASYFKKDRPSTCDAENDNGVQPASDSNGKSGSSGGLSAGAIIGIVFVVILVNVGFMICYRRCQKREMNQRLTSEVNSAVSAYFALSESGQRETYH